MTTDELIGYIALGLVAGIVIGLYLGLPPMATLGPSLAGSAGGIILTLHTRRNDQ